MRHTTCVSVVSLCRFGKTGYGLSLKRYGPLPIVKVGCLLAMADARVTFHAISVDSHIADMYGLAVRRFSYSHAWLGSCALDARVTMSPCTTL